MASTITDLLASIDEYMANNGEGDSFLANKMKAIFSDKDAPLNAEDGPLKAFSDKINNLVKSVEKFDKKFSKFDAKTKELSDSFSKILTRSKKTVLNFDNMNSTIGNWVKKMKKTAIPTSIPSGSKHTLNIDYKKMSDAFAVSSLRLLDNATWRNKNIMLSQIALNRALTFDRKERNKEKELIDRDNVPQSSKNIIYNKYYNNRSSITSGDSEGKKSSFLGKLWDIAKWPLGLFLIGKGFDFINKTPIGRLIKDKIGGFFGSMFDKVSDYFHTGSFTETIKSGIVGIGGLLKGLFKTVFNFFKDHKEDIAESIVDIGETFYENLIKPVFNSIGNDFKNKDYSSALFKTGLFTGISALILKKLGGPVGRIGFSLKGLRKMFTKFGGIFKSFGNGLLDVTKKLGSFGMRALASSSRAAVGGLSSSVRALGTPQGLVGVAAIATIIAWTVAIKKGIEYQKQLQKDQELYSNLSKGMAKNIEYFTNKISDRTKQIEELKKQQESDFSSSRMYTIRRLEEENRRDEQSKQFTIESKKLDEKIKAHDKLTLFEWKKLSSYVPMKYVYHFFGAKSSANELEKLTKNQQMSSHLFGLKINEWTQFEKKAQDAEQINKIKTQQNIDTLLKEIQGTSVNTEQLQKLTAQISTEKKPSTVQTPTLEKKVVELNSKVDQLNESINYGYQQMVNATYQSGRSVAATVAASSKGAGPQNPHITGSGGGSPIRDYRDRNNKFAK